MIAETPVLVLDTSVILNLLGSGRARFLLHSLPYQSIAPPAVIRELQREPEVQFERDAGLRDLIDGGLLTVLEPDDNLHALAFSLAGAPSPDDLDDGEAYAIACAATLSAAIAIDERKGRRVISERWPLIKLLFTLELIEVAVALAKLSNEEVSGIVFAALRNSRMRVPKSRLNAVVKLIGYERAQLCPSLGMSFPET